MPVLPASTSPTLACRAIDARWEEVISEVEQLGEDENERAVAILMHWTDLAMVALEHTPPVPSRGNSNGRREPERPAHAAANALAKHVQDAATAIQARLAPGTASAQDIRPCQRRIANALDQFHVKMSGDHISQRSQPMQQSSTKFAGTPTEQLSPKLIGNASGIPVQKDLPSPSPVVVHATAIVVEQRDETPDERTEDFVARWCRKLTFRSSRPQRHLQRQVMSSLHQPPCPVSVMQSQAQPQTGARGFEMRDSASSYKNAVLHDVLHDPLLV